MQTLLRTRSPVHVRERKNTKSTFFEKHNDLQVGQRSSGCTRDANVPSDAFPRAQSKMRKNTNYIFWSKYKIYIQVGQRNSGCMCDASALWDAFPRELSRLPPLCTLHPIPYTPHPTPHTLHSTPYTLYPPPYTLHLTPHTPRSEDTAPGKVTPVIPHGVLSPDTTPCRMTGVTLHGGVSLDPSHQTLPISYADTCDL